MPSIEHNAMVKGYRCAVLANTLFDLRNRQEAERASAIGGLLARNPDPVQDGVAEARNEAADDTIDYAVIFDKLVAVAEALMPARPVFDGNIVFSTSHR